MHDAGCINPLWPCAMTGAVACLAGFSDLGVIVHGSSGCYYYTETLVPVPVHSTFLVEEEVIFGAERRLREVVGDLAAMYSRVAVVNTCVPSVIGEDIRQFLEEYDVMIVDAPGFSGHLEDGWKNAIDTLAPGVDEQRQGVNIDGLFSADPFYHGNRMEAERLLAMAGIPPATRFCADTLGAAYRATPVSVAANPDFRSGVGTEAGSLVGIKPLKSCFSRIAALCSDADVGPVMEAVDEAEERIVHTCDRHLRRFDPPAAAIFSGFGQADAVATMLRDYLDAEIAVIGSRNRTGPSAFKVEETRDLDHIAALIARHAPDLVIGSAYEETVAGGAAFVPLTLPMRGRVILAHRPLAGTEGALGIMESVLNACMDTKQKK
ncbi:MAG: nitrogenase component 1 [Methanomicrobiaceae archaeon]|nr:nitrogenase component 1 [Methanomicrobiaceae archaeon]